MQEHAFCHLDFLDLSRKTRICCHEENLKNKQNGCFSCLNLLNLIIWILKMSGPAKLPQSKEALLKSYQTRLKDDVKSMLENFEGKQ